MAELSEARRKEGEALLRRAFGAAKASGRQDWQRMTTAVLKNRLLTLTNREFSERDWGVRTFSAFVDLFPQVISIDASVFPPIAELRGDPAIHESDAETPEGIPPRGQEEMTPHQRVRADLWRAVLDFSSGAVYLWDANEGMAVASAEEDAGQRGPLIPTATPEVLDAWREEFITRHEKLLGTQQVQVLRRWKDQGLGTHSLPSGLRGRWNGLSGGTQVGTHL